MPFEIITHKRLALTEADRAMFPDGRLGVGEISPHHYSGWDCVKMVAQMTSLKVKELGRSRQALNARDWSTTRTRPSRLDGYEFALLAEIAGTESQKYWTARVFISRLLS